ncbi:MAG: Isoleucine 2-epimerase [Chloroflexi bacterium]|nr:Isoleucine 2-epimerase [Chloroflexota bacterium]
MRSREIVAKDQTLIPPAFRVSYFPLVVQEGTGATVTDVDGRVYIDLLASAAVSNTGHAHPRVVDAITRQAKAFIHYTPAYMYHEHLVRLAEQLVSLTPGEFPKRVRFGLSGSDANDGVIKFARAYTGRQKVVSFFRSYHGSTYGALSLSAITPNMRRKMGPFLPEIYHIPFPDCYRCSFGRDYPSCEEFCWEQIESSYFQTILPPDEVAAIVVEPIQGDAGIIVPPPFFLPQLRKFCTEHGSLLVDEEIQTGFGRTGKWFAIEYWGVIPDIVVMGKAIASGMPLSALVARADILEALEPPADLFTCAGNPVACAAALATIEVIREERLVERSAKLGQYAMDRLLKMKDRHQLIGDVRGKGLSIGVDLVKNRQSKERAVKEALKVCWRCYEKGVLLISFSGSVLRIQPPLVIAEGDLEYALNVIDESLTEVEKGMVPDAVLEGMVGW